MGAVADVATVGSTALNGAGCIAETGLDQLASCTGTATGLAGATIGAFAPSAGFWAAQGKTLWQLEFGLYDVVSQSALLASNHVAIGLSLHERTTRVILGRMLDKLVSHDFRSRTLRTAAPRVGEEAAIEYVKVWEAQRAFALALAPPVLTSLISAALGFEDGILTLPRLANSSNLSLRCRGKSIVTGCLGLRVHTWESRSIGYAPYTWVITGTTGGSQRIPMCDARQRSRPEEIDRSSRLLLRETRPQWRTRSISPVDNCVQRPSWISTQAIVRASGPI